MYVCMYVYIYIYIYIYIYYNTIYFLYGFVFSLKVALIAESCRLLLITNKVLYILYLYLFYLLVHLKKNRDALSKKRHNNLTQKVT